MLCVQAVLCNRHRLPEQHTHEAGSLAGWWGCSSSEDRYFSLLSSSAAERRHAQVPFASRQFRATGSNRLNSTYMRRAYWQAGGAARPQKTSTPPCSGPRC